MDKAWNLLGKDAPYLMSNIDTGFATGIDFLGKDGRENAH
jgi:hypothetical protein